ncbi:MAG: hypothetical protein DRG82_16845, partial [Deltaproteobacteria bacterium]
MKEKNLFKHVVLSLALIIYLAGGCGSDSSVVTPPADGNWWANYLDPAGNPLTLPSGFKLVPIAGHQRTATPKTTPPDERAVLNFAIDPDYRSNRGWLFRGHDQGSDAKQDLAGCAEFIKQAGWLRIGETFDWDRQSARYTQPPQIRLTFIGWAGDLMLTYLGEPYIGFPTDTTKTWTGKPVTVSDGSGNEFVEIFSYRIRF